MLTIAVVELVSVGEGDGLELWLLRRLVLVKPSLREEVREFGGMESVEEATVVCAARKLVLAGSDIIPLAFVEWSGRVVLSDVWDEAGMNGIIIKCSFSM